MRYYVVIDGTRVEVERDGEEVRVNGDRAERAVLTVVAGSPVLMLAIGDGTQELHRITARRDGPRGQYVLRVDGRRHAVEALDERVRSIRDLAAARAEASGPRPLAAPMPGLVVGVHVVVGQRVERGQGVIAMEAMKMENELRAPAPGTVRVVHAKVGEAVEKGAVLVEFD
jgi:biotin carboxyl carrier protein